MWCKEVVTLLGMLEAVNRVGQMLVYAHVCVYAWLASIV